MPEASDMELLRDYHRHGSETAFAELVRRHIHFVYSVATRHVGVAAHAEEITQAVFVILARKAGGLRPDTILDGWLHETTRLTALSFLRGERRRQFREQEAYMQSTLEESPENAVWHQLSPLLDEAMARLGTQDRDAVILRFFKAQSVREVAAAMQVSEPAAQRRVLRAVDKLRQFFAERGVDSPADAITNSITAHSIQMAPAGLAAAVMAAAKGAAVSTSTLTLIKGALKIMAWTKVKTAVVVSVGVLVSVGTATVIVSKVYPREPVYQGQTLSAWLASLETHPMKFINLEPETNQPAAEAFQAMGAKAVPFLRRELRSGNLLRQKRAVDAARAIGPTAKELIPDILPVANAFAKSGRDSINESMTMAALGPEAIGPLTSLFTNKNGWVRMRAVSAFREVPYNAEAAIPALLNALSDPETYVRSEAAPALTHIHQQLDVVIPALVKNLSDPNKEVRWMTAFSLGELGTDGKPAVPALIQLLKDDDDVSVRAWTKEALRKIDPLAAAQAGVK